MRMSKRVHPSRREREGIRARVAPAIRDESKAEKDYLILVLLTAHREAWQ